MNSLIIGTAGHIDHGKTSLIKALNGFDGDSLDAEKERGITINLSFSNIKNGDENISFIDVPGHENLVKTMISGAFSFDLALFVVAADDGIMPQSIEHLIVLSILGVKNIIVAITKCDKVEFSRQNEVLEQTKQELIKHNLNMLNSFFVSIKDNSGIEELKNYFFNLKAKKRNENDVFRYYIDRVFNIKGIGTIVTGSVLGGCVKVGEKILNCELNKEIGVRSIQIHDSNVLVATSSTRAALNLNTSNILGISKGQLLSKKGYFRGFNEIDAIVYADELKHNDVIGFCVGSKQINAKVAILSDEKYKFATFKFPKPMFLMFNEAFVILKNARVIGGGNVLNPINEPMKKPNKISLLLALKDKNFKKAFEILKKAHKNGFGLIGSYQRFALSHEEAISIAKTLPNAFVDEVALNVYDESAKFQIIEFIKFIISKNKYAMFSATSISLKLNWASVALSQLAINELENIGIITKNDGIYTKTGIDISELKAKLTEQIYSILDSENLTPQAPYNIYDSLEIDRASGDNALKILTKQGRVVRLAHNLFITKKHLQTALLNLKQIIKDDGYANVQNVKDKLGLSRKFAIAYLEILDSENDIIKIENNRIFKKNL